MSNYLFTSDLAVSDALAIEKLVKACYNLPPCKWCQADLADFMLPHNLSSGSDLVYCIHCKRCTQIELDGRCLAPIMEAWCNSRHSAHEGIREVFTSIKAGGDESITFPTDQVSADISLGLRTYSGVPHLVSFSWRDDGHDRKTRLYDWMIFSVISRVINQAVLSRLDHVPEFDYDSAQACPRCGAGSASHETRNFNPVARQADIHCGKCGYLIHRWDPS